MITFILPGENSVYSFGSPILVNILVSDNKQLKDVRIDITDASNNIILQPASFPMDEIVNDKTIQHSFPFTDEKIPSGVYYIRVIANDGENIQTAYRQISLTGAARAVERFLVMRTDAGGNTLVDEITQNGLQPYAASSLISYGAGYYSSLKDFSCISDPAGNVSVYSQDYFELYSSFSSWSIVENAYTASFIDYNAQEVWLGGKTGYIVHLKNSGQLQLAQTSGGSAEEIIALRRQGEYLIYIGKNIVTNNYRIYTCLADNLQTVHSTELSVEPVALLSEENELRMLVACNEGAQGSFKHYYILENAISDVFFFFNNTPITNAWTGPNGKNYVAHDNGFSIYDPGMKTWIESTATPPIQIRFNEVDGSVILVYADEILLMDEELQSEFFSLSANTIRDVWILYNK